MLMSQFFYATYSLVDILFLGLLGPSAVAAAAIGGTVEALNWILLTALDVACRSLIARRFGAADEAGARRVAFQSVILVAILSAAVAFVGYFFARPFLSVLGAKEEVLGAAVTYLRILAVGSFSLFSIQIGKAVLEALGDARTPMRIMFVSAGANIIFDPLLIFGFGWLPALGVGGAALATLLARLIGIVLLLRALLSKNCPLRFKLRDFKYDGETIRELISLAIPRSLQRSLEVVSMLVLMRLVIPYGTYGLAAHGIGLRIDLAMRTPGYGFGNAVVTLVGQHLGMGKPEHVKRIVWTVAGNYMALAGAAVFAFVFFPASIMTLFTDHPDVLGLGIDYLRIMGGAFIFLAMGIIFERSLAGSGDTISPMLISACVLVLLQIAGATVFALFLDVRGIWLANALAYVVWATLLAFWFHRGAWKAKSALTIPGPTI
jgi:putative MATE family efflux protein